MDTRLVKIEDIEAQSADIDLAAYPEIEIEEGD